MAKDIHGMVEKRGSGLWLTHVFMILGVLIIFFPIWLAFVASTVTQPEIVKPPMPLWPGDQLWENYSKALFSGINVPVSTMLVNSFIMAISIAVGKIIISLLSAFAIVYFRFPGRNFFFWMIFLTLMLPVEVRIVPTYEVVAGFGMLNSYGGLIFPLIASATACFFAAASFSALAASAAACFFAAASSFALSVSANNRNKSGVTECVFASAAAIISLVMPALIPKATP